MSYLAKQKRASPKESINYFEEMRGQMEMENMKRRKICNSINSKPELRFLQFNPNRKDACNSSQLDGKTLAKKSWKPPVKEVSNSSKTNSIEGLFHKTVKSSENPSLQQSINEPSLNLDGNNTDGNILKTNKSEEKAENIVQTDPYRSVTQLKSQSGNNDLYSTPKSTMENRIETGLSITENVGNVFELSEINTSRNIVAEFDLEMEHILQGNSENNEINNFKHNEDVSTNAKLTVIDEVSSEICDGPQNEQEVKDYSEHQDILDSIEVILSEGQIDKTDICKDYSKISNESRIILKDSLFEEDICSSGEQLSSNDKSTKSPSLHNDEQTEHKIEEYITENHLSVCEGLKIQINDNKRKIIEEKNQEELEGRSNGTIDSQHLDSLKHQTSSQEKELVEIKSKLFEITENDGPYVNSEKDVNNLTDKEENIDETFDDIAGEDCSSLMISHSQLLQIEQNCYNVSDDNRSEIHEKKERSFTVNNLAEPLRTKSVCTQTDHSSSLPTFQSNSSVEHKVLWTTEMQERQKKLKAVIQEVERLNSQLLKIRQQVWPK